ncbi:MAG TPA: four helix bundle protein [Chthoniobacterales bacterium]
MNEFADGLKNRTKQLALRIIKMSESSKRSIAADILIRQIIRSGTSVGANYREAYRARSDAEFISKMGDSLREIEETAYWLDLIGDSGIVPKRRLAELETEINELTAIWVTIIKSKRRKQPS